MARNSYAIRKTLRAIMDRVESTNKDKSYIKGGKLAVFQDYMELEKTVLTELQALWDKAYEAGKNDLKNW